MFVFEVVKIVSRGNITVEELTLVKSYILLPFIQTVFERDKAIMQTALKTPAPYIDTIDRAMDQVTVLLREIRKEFKTTGIKVYEITRSANGIHARYTCRGYTGEMRLMWSSIRAEIEMRMRAYLGVNNEQLQQNFLMKINRHMHIK